jgi:hypothetical protein
MESSMRELKIESIDFQTTYSVNLLLKVDQNNLIYITAKNCSGEKTIFVSVGYNKGIPYAISSTSFDASNSNMDAEEIKDRVLDWLISEDGSSIIKNAIN